jgi:hypothetical protein
MAGRGYVFLNLHILTIFNKSNHPKWQLHDILYLKIYTFTGLRAHKLFREAVAGRYLTRDVGKLSPLHQTHGLEMYHSVVNSFAPKNTHFFYPAMMARYVSMIISSKII